jgi:hypothetical protein
MYLFLVKMFSCLHAKTEAIILEHWLYQSVNRGGMVCKSHFQHLTSNTKLFSGTDTLHRHFNYFFSYFIKHTLH